MTEQEWEDQKDEVIRDLLDVYKRYYPDDLEWWDVGQLVTILGKTVELGIMYQDTITEPLVNDYLVRIRNWLLKTKPAHGSLFGFEKSDLRDFNPRSPTNIGPKAAGFTNEYKDWERSIKARYPTYAPFIKFNTYGTPGDQYTKAEWPEKEVAFGRFDWKTMTGKDYKVKAVPMGDEPSSEELKFDAKVDEWKKEVIKSQEGRIPGFASKVKFSYNPDTRYIVAVIPNLRNIKGEPMVFGSFNTLSNQGQLVGGDELTEGIEQMEPEMEKLEIWKEAVRTRYPKLKSKIRFVSKDQGKHISAEIPGMNRSFGVFDMDTMTGHVLSESKGVTKKVFEDFMSELDIITGVYK